MRNNKSCTLCLVSIVALLLSAGQTRQKPLAEIYRGGTVRFIPELILDESALPEGAFFESVVDIKCDPEGNVYFCDYKANNIKGYRISE